MTGRMRIYPDRSVSGEFEQLGTDGFTGTLNDRQFAQLGALGLTGALADRFGAWDGTVNPPIDVGGGQTEELTDPVENVVTFNFTTGKKNRPAANDVVFALVSEISTSDVAFGNISGYTKAAELYANDDYDTNMALYYKVMSVTPDTTITVPGSANKRSLAILAFENLDVNTPLDLGIISVTATNAGQPNPSAITPVNAGAKVLVCGGSGAATADAAVFTSGELSNFITRQIDSGGGASHVIGMGVLDWDGSSAVDPAAFGGNTAAVTASWGAFTVALKARTVEGTQLNIPALIGTTPAFFWDPDDASTLFTDTTATTPAALGDLVAAWTDKSGQARAFTQATSAKRPIYVKAPPGGRRNFFANTTDLTASGWTASNCAVTYEGVVDGQPAWRLTTVTSDAISDIYANQQRTRMWSGNDLDGRLSIEFKPGNVSTIKLVIQRTSTDFDESYYNAATSWSSAETPAKFTVTALADGWYRVSSSVGNSNASDTRLCGFGPQDDVAVASPLFTTSGNYILVRNPQYEVNQGTPTNFQSVTSNGNLVTESGLVSRGWLQTNGNGVAMLSSAIDLTSTDKLDLVVGLSRHSVQASNFPVVLESSADATLNNGTFSMLTGWNGANNFAAGLRGTSLLERNTTNPFAEKISGTLAARYNIGGADISSELSGQFNDDTALTTVTGSSAGTGNFGNHALRLAARNTSFLYYFGLIGPIVGIGRTLDTADFNALVDWVDARVRA